MEPADDYKEMVERGIHVSRWIYDPSMENDLDAILALLPEFRRRKALSFRFVKDRLLSAQAYLLLWRSLKDCYGLCDPPEFGYADGGKPFLRGHEDIHFNLSHCYGASGRRSAGAAGPGLVSGGGNPGLVCGGAICVVGDRPVGCDIEVISPELDYDFCACCCNESEMSRILSSGAPTAEFARLWTMKEAYLKLTGEGLRDDMKEVLTGMAFSGVEFESEVSLADSLATTVCTRRR